MDDHAVHKQLDNMVSFIKKEAEEKASEILILAEEEFNIEKGKTVQSQKIKLMKEFERKEKQVDVKKKIFFSNALNQARLEKLRAQQVAVQTVLQEALDRLAEITTGPDYKDLLAKLTLQGTIQMEEKNISVKVRAEDQNVIRSILPQAEKEYKALTKRDVSLTLDPEPLKCVGGVVLTALEGRILCNNTLETRLSHAYEAALPRIRGTLFAE